MHCNDKDNGGVVLLVGLAFGKSLLLRMLAGAEHPVVRGAVIVGGGNLPCRTTGVKTALIPVVLDRKPDFDNSLTVAERIVWAGLDAVRERKCKDRGRRKC